MNANQDREIQAAFDWRYAGETLQKLYLELAHVVPKDCITYRETRLGKVADIYGLALRMIMEGGADPREIAKGALNKVAVAKWNMP